MRTSIPIRWCMFTFNVFHIHFLIHHHRIKSHRPWHRLHHPNFTIPEHERIPLDIPHIRLLLGMVVYIRCWTTHNRWWCCNLLLHDGQEPPSKTTGRKECLQSVQVPPRFYRSRFVLVGRCPYHKSRSLVYQEKSKRKRDSSQSAQVHVGLFAVLLRVR